MFMAVRPATNYEKLAKELLVPFYCQNAFVLLLLKILNSFFHFFHLATCISTLFIQIKLLNVITLVQTKTDIINRLITIIESKKLKNIWNYCCYWSF
jgi:hypothetical protein